MLTGLLELLFMALLWIGVVVFVIWSFGHYFETIDDTSSPSTSTQGSQAPVTRHQ